jgi:hypothetical protein
MHPTRRPAAAWPASSSSMVSECRGGCGSCQSARMSRDSGVFMGSSLVGPTGAPMLS